MSDSKNAYHMQWIIWTWLYVSMKIFHSKYLINTSSMSINYRKQNTFVTLSRMAISGHNPQLYREPWRMLQFFQIERKWFSYIIHLCSRGVTWNSKDEWWPHFFWRKISIRYIYVRTGQDVDTFFGSKIKIVPTYV